MDIIEGELVDTLVKIGGDINTISVNGELQEVIKGNVDIKVPTKTSDLENDTNYVVKEQADNDYANKQVTEQSLATANENITNVENGLNVANGKITALENDNETLHTNIETLSNGLEETDGKVTSLENDLDAHKTQSSQAFEDLGASIQELEGNVATAQETADQAKAIAEGKATGYVFDTYGDMVSWVASHSAELKLGDNLYIRATDVPDYWWDGTSTQPLETQKVDLSGYQEKLTAGENITIENNVISAAGGADEGLRNNTVQIVPRSGGLKIGGADAVRDGIAIGKDAYAAQPLSIAIGQQTRAYGTYGVAIGFNSNATGSKSFQLGAGTNPKANTLQIYNDNIYNHSTHTLSVQNLTDGTTTKTMTEVLAGGGGSVAVDNTTISKNTEDELQAIGLTDGENGLTFEEIYQALSIERTV